MNVVLNVIIVLCLIALLISCIGLIGTEIVYRNGIKIIDAIFAYKVSCIEKGMFEEEHWVKYSDMHDRFRLFDTAMPWKWKCEALLPPEKYQIIKPYLKGNKDGK